MEWIQSKDLIPSPHVEVFLSKALEPKLFQIAVASLYECACEWMNVTCSVRSALSGLKTIKVKYFINAVHLHT